MSSTAPSHTPRVAVIVPAYGVAHLVGEALDSVLAQTIDDWECIIIDDGAPDDVAGAVAPYLEDSRFTFLQTANGGVSSARNTAIAAASAPLIALLDGDDLLRPRYLEVMCAAMEADPQARLASPNGLNFGAVEREYLCFLEKQGSGDGRTGSLADVLDRSFGVYIGSTFRRDDWEAVGGFDTAMSHAEDFDFWVRLMMLGGHALYVDEVLGEYRVRANSASSANIKMLLGTLATYRKAEAKLPSDAPERPVLNAMIAENLRALSFEQAVDKVIAGDTSAVSQLRASRGPAQGRLWDALFVLWSAIPALATPMLDMRRRRNARGATS